MFHHHAMKRIYRVLRKILRVDRQILETEQASMGYLAQLVTIFSPKPITGFIIRRISMAFPPITPGTTAVYTATPVPAGAIPTQPPTWTSSDTVNAPISVDSTGLVATVAVPTTSTPPPEGITFTLSVNYNNPDGTPANGAITDTIVPGTPPPPVNITSFDVARTA